MIIDAIDAAAGTDAPRPGTDISRRDKIGFIRNCQMLHPGAILVTDVNQMVSAILVRAGTGPTINLLRFFGHGGAGIQSMANSHVSMKDYQNIMIDRNGRLTNRTELGRLRGHFAPDAVVELQGCNVALGHNGRELLRQLADLWNVRVRGAVDSQYPDSADRFEGPIIEAVPGIGHSARVHRVR